ncbi:MAG: choice-of-anchor B family protein [Bacteroidetes bacterium]|nr:MAG: choice-of-anchor B family protein [Bacteroidota bacterium]
MKKIVLLLIGFSTSLFIFAQNTNVLFRSKVTFPGQTVANVWGYTAQGREYALVGASKGLVIVDVTDPDAPQQIVQIPGPNNLWKEIKTYRQYAYIVSEGGQGVQIVDMSNLPSANLNYHFYTGDGPIQGQLGKIHALHIDVATGYLYAYGGNLFSGGAKVLDLNADPYNPVYAGKFSQLGYIHDGYVDNDTMYSAHIYQGFFAMVDMRDKNNPVVLATQNTPKKFTHNTWLSDDRRTLYATDETSNSYLASYDISDPDNITFLDQIQSNPGTNSVVHNTHILGNYAITAWYKDGFTIVDITRPDNLVQVGNYDTYPGGAGSGYDGCWGVYPYFPSGTIIASTIELPGTSDGELWVLTPQYVRACYLEGTITNGLTGNPLNGVIIDIVGSDQTQTSSDGSYRAGQEAEGYFVVRISKTGFQEQEFTVYFQRGSVRKLNTTLYPTGGLQVTGQVIDGAANTPVSDAFVTFSSWSGSWETQTDASGSFLLTDIPSGIYDVVAYAAGLGQTAKYKYKIESSQNLILTIFSKYSKFRPEQTHRNADDLLAWPNPFNEEISLALPSGQEQYRLKVLNARGGTVGEYFLQNTDDGICIGATWPPGVYYLYLECPEQKLPLVKKIVKLR